MDFTWAYKQLRDGKKITRDRWKKSFYLIMLTDCITQDNDGDLWKFNHYDFIGDDWDFFEEPETLSDKMFAIMYDGHCEDAVLVDDINDALEKIAIIISKKYILDYNTQIEIDEVLGKEFDLIMHNKV